MEGAVPIRDGNKIVHFGLRIRTAKGAKGLDLKRSHAENAETEERIREAVALLEAGELAILPTDTVYGICADVRRDDAVMAIYSAKGKAPEVPLQLLFGTDRKLIERYAVPASRPDACWTGLGLGRGPSSVDRARLGISGARGR
jgi:hypothetical protein